MLADERVGAQPEQVDVEMAVDVPGRPAQNGSGDGVLRML